VTFTSALWVSFTSALTGGRVLDPFAGSGTTLVAAEAEGYLWTGIEMTEHYVDVTRLRVGR
ncbi:DNA methyltransferase, partial [Xanthomonas citri]|uniref:DNA methyltransferase n=1 Tax=Xanthomonas citri TaxID=346 RepID=UPI001430DB77